MEKPRKNILEALFPEEGKIKEPFWYALAITFTLLSSSLGYIIVNDELIKPEIYDGSVYSLGRQGFTADAYQYISENSEYPVIAIGTSKMRESFNGEDFEKRSQFDGIDYYNMGIGGNNDYWRMIETQRIIEANPEIVIMEIGPNTFSSLPYPIDQGSIDRMNAFLFQQPFLEDRDWLEILDENDSKLLPLDVLDRINYTSTISFVAIEEHLKELHEGPRGYECD